jgi:hypothetical protein
LENQRLKDLVKDLKFHKDPVGAGVLVLLHTDTMYGINTVSLALQSMVIIKQPRIGGEGTSISLNYR